jgi:regulatory protein
MDALAYAFKLLGYRPRSSRELQLRLKAKGYEAEDIEKAMARLLELGYIDDHTLAVSLADQASRLKTLGRMGARRFLGIRGIGRDHVEEALSDYDELEAAGRLVMRKLPTLFGLDRRAAMGRISGYLGRRGFSHQTIRTWLNRLTQTEGSDEWEA